MWNSCSTSPGPGHTKCLQGPSYRDYTFLNLTAFGDLSTPKYGVQLRGCADSPVPTVSVMYLTTGHNIPPDILGPNSKLEYQESYRLCAAASRLT